MMKKLLNRGLGIGKNLWSDSLYRNSFWLMAGSYCMSAIGFIYWLVATKLYTPEQIGLATTFLSALSLISGFSMLGFGTTLIKFLPTSNQKDKKINTAFTIVALTSILLGILFVIGLDIWSPKLLFIRSSLITTLAVLLYFPLNSINSLTDSIFTAYRKTQFVFISNILQSLCKLMVLILLSSIGVWGIINSNLIGITTAVTFSMLVIIYSFKTKIDLKVNKDILYKVKTFALGNYIASTIGSIPNLILPLIITNKLSAQETAFFYIPNMIISLLTIIPSTVSRSYFSESSNKNENLSILKPLLLSYALIIPIVVVVIAFGNLILSQFGKAYSTNGYQYLVLVSMSTLISVINYFLGTKYLVLNKLKKIIAIMILSSTTNLILSYKFINFGISGIGYASIMTQLITFGILSISLRSKRSPAN